MRDKETIARELKNAQKQVCKLRAELRKAGGGRPTNKRKRHIYILKCKGNRYYVGQTVNIARRLREHQEGVGGWFTAKYPPIGVVDNFYVGYMTEKEAMYYENQTTARYMEIYSIDKVRGGDFNTRDKKYWENKVGEWTDISYTKKKMEL